MRERSKATWVLGVRRARAPYLALGRRLHERGVIARPDDARFVTYDEMRRLAARRKVEGLSAAIARRRRQFRRAQDYVLPDNWVGEARPARRPPAPEATTLEGLGVSIGAGPVRGTARIIASAEAGLARDIEPGEILVAPFTDAPWTPLFIPAGAVVVETGGVLSHAATVAREFAIPAVVMCKDATRVIHDGDTVEVDGATGSVRILERAALGA
jgi:pyruvate,water dikinase